MAAKRPKQEDRHTGRMLGVWMPLENHAALDLIAAKEYRSKSAIVMRALAEYCKKRKHEWPSADRPLAPEGVPASEHEKLSKKRLATPKRKKS